MRRLLLFTLIIGVTAGITAAPRYENLFEAAKAGDLDDVKLWLTLGAPIEMKRDGGKTPLLIAVQRNYPLVVDTLLLAGANVNAVDDSGRSVLHLSILAHNDSLLQRFCELAVDVNALDYLGNSPLMYTVHSANRWACILLLKANADPNIANRGGCVPLYAAKILKCWPIADVLRTYGAKEDCPAKRWSDDIEKDIKKLYGR
jgi:ankyrin repeat protein